MDLNRTRADLRRELKLPEDAPIAGMVCRLIEQKGVSFALQAFAQLAEKHPAAHLAIVGDGPLRPALEAEAGALGIAGRTHFLGWRDDAARCMAGFDMLLMPSLWEGFGIVMLEAMAAAVPIIGSDVSAIPEVVVNNETGYLFSSGDVDALATALDVLLGDKPLRRHMGLLGQERLETVFDADRMVVATASLYMQMTGGINSDE
ncbi:MAG: glycosyltransferase [Chloroflexi bacterium]|nr:glycosyltransferase [Chloroflexota bacterium]